MGKQRIDAYAAQDMYVNGATVAIIAQRFNVSRVAIWKAWKRIGFSTSGYRVKLSCEHCGKAIERTRSYARRTRHFCDPACYIAWIQAKTSYRPWRQGQRRARRVVSQYFDVPDGAVIDHRDGDCRNNAPENLRVYASQADHMRMHRGGRVNPLWEFTG